MLGLILLTDVAGKHQPAAAHGVVLGHKGQLQAEGAAVPTAPGQAAGRAFAKLRDMRKICASLVSVLFLSACGQAWNDPYPAAVGNIDHRVTPLCEFSLHWIARPELAPTRGPLSLEQLERVPLLTLARWWRGDFATLWRPPAAGDTLARRLHAPNLNLIYEAGVVGAQPARLPLRVRPRSSRLVIEPEYRYDVAAARVSLDARLRVSVRGAPASRIVVLLEASSSLASLA